MLFNHKLGYETLNVKSYTEMTKALFGFELAARLRYAKLTLLFETF